MTHACEHYALGPDRERYCGLCGSDLPPERDGRARRAARTLGRLLSRWRVLLLR